MGGAGVEKGRGYLVSMDVFYAIISYIVKSEPDLFTLKVAHV